MIHPLKNHSPKSTRHLACRRNGTTFWEIMTTGKMPRHK
ncbi:hypothetical protein GLYMA_08G093350v4 [Glycine max]|nr:hypothetical protein GLYMA_08G093350v4 [Glycine max]KAH1050382.1 hypothetical protein GYH30_020727 [Glycine max]